MHRDPAREGGVPRRNSARIHARQWRSHPPRRRPHHPLISHMTSHGRGRRAVHARRVRVVLPARRPLGLLARLARPRVPVRHGAVPHLQILPHGGTTSFWPAGVKCPLRGTFSPWPARGLPKRHAPVTSRFDNHTGDRRSGPPCLNFLNELQIAVPSEI